MKRIALCLTLALCVGAAPGKTPVNYNAFGITLLQRCAGSGTQNVFISPVSIGVALSMAAEGAKGMTRDAMLRTLELSVAQLSDGNAALIDALHANKDASVGIADALWTRNDVLPRAQYAQLLAQRYGAHAQALHFGDPSAADAINAWTKQHTLGLIDKIVDRTTPQDFVYLTNALAFKGDWTRPFKKNDTRAAPFTNADGSKTTVQMMSQSGTFPIFDASNYSAARLPYGGGGYAAYILLPKENDVRPLLKTLTAGTFDTIARNAQQAYVAISVPRFTAQYQASLVPLLKAMGMRIAFTEDADFSGIHAIPPRLAITSVNHAAFVRVDEKGTTAAAATSVGIGLLAIRQPEKRFVVDHPFVFAIRDERTGALLFIGVFNRLGGGVGG